MEYGHPAGHAMFSAIHATAVLFDFTEKNKSRTKNVRIAYGIVQTVSAVIYIYAMGWIRVITADHTWDQVIFGWLLGIWLSAFM